MDVEVGEPRHRLHNRTGLSVEVVTAFEGHYESTTTTFFRESHQVVGHLPVRGVDQPHRARQVCGVTVRARGHNQQVVRDPLAGRYNDALECREVFGVPGAGGELQ